ncbi:hypothetical protein T09_2417 [Trichinella sp. T9]|nr:hypothetical protein T09_2417 [Trichinella sp. T9]
MKHEVINELKRKERSSEKAIQCSEKQRKIGDKPVNNKSAKQDYQNLADISLLILSIETKVVINFYDDSMTPRCKVLYNIMRQEWPNEEKDCIIRPEAMDDISNIIELSQRPTPYPTQMLRYSQLAGFYLIYAYLICDLAHPIMKDSYMQTYALYRRIIVMMGDQALRRLTYIAVKVAQKKDPLLAHLRHIELHDTDDLIRIKKDFFMYFINKLTTLHYISS